MNGALAPPPQMFGDRWIWLSMLVKRAEEPIADQGRAALHARWEQQL